MGRKPSPGRGMTSAPPRYVQVAVELSARIAAGTYPVGSFLPTEIELCDAFGISRHTVREALRRLADAGLVKRRQGSGSQITATRPHAAYVHEMRSLAGLFQYAAHTRFEIARIRLAVPAGDSPVDAADSRAEWLVVEGLRRDPLDGSAICVSTVYIAGAFAGIAGDLRAHDGAIYALIEQRFGVEVADVEQAIAAGPMPAEAARDLGLSRKGFAVRVVRRYRDAEGRLMLASVNFHPAERFSYTMHLRREGRGFA
jgi:DNA-binding GntR family transcriptional regulator